MIMIMMMCRNHNFNFYAVPRVHLSTQLIRRDSVNYFTRNCNCDQWIMNQDNQANDHLSETEELQDENSQLR